jgi:hypothetical protein
LLSGPNACGGKRFDAVKWGGVRHDAYSIAVIDSDLREMAIDARLVLMVREETETKIRTPPSE